MRFKKKTEEQGEGGDKDWISIPSLYEIQFSLCEARAVVLFSAHYSNSNPQSCSKN